MTDTRCFRPDGCRTATSREHEAAHNEGLSAPLWAAPVCAWRAREREIRRPTDASPQVGTDKGRLRSGRDGGCGETTACSSAARADLPSAGPCQFRAARAGPSLDRPPGAPGWPLHQLPSAPLTVSGASLVFRWRTHRPARALHRRSLRRQGPEGGGLRARPGWGAGGLRQGCCQ